MDGRQSGQQPHLNVPQEEIQHAPGVLVSSAPVPPTPAPCPATAPVKKPRTEKQIAAAQKLAESSKARAAKRKAEQVQQQQKPIVKKPTDESASDSEDDDGGSDYRSRTPSPVPRKKSKIQNAPRKAARESNRDEFDHLREMSLKAKAEKMMSRMVKARDEPVKKTNLRSRVTKAAPPPPPDSSESSEEESEDESEQSYKTARQHPTPTPPQRQQVAQKRVRPNPVESQQSQATQQAWLAERQKAEAMQRAITGMR